MTFSWIGRKDLQERTHRVQFISISRDRHSEPEFQFELQAYCGELGYVSRLAIDEDEEAINCGACCDALTAVGK